MIAVALASEARSMKRTWRSIPFGSNPHRCPVRATELADAEDSRELTGRPLGDSGAAGYRVQHLGSLRCHRELRLVTIVRCEWHAQPAAVQAATRVN